MLRKLYDGVFNLARGRHATPALAMVAFAESSFFPIPPDVIRKLANHPLTNSGIDGFLKDWKATGQSIL